MTILAIRTDKPEAELYIYKENKKLAETKWLAHHKLAETLYSKIEDILNMSSISYEDIGGLAVYKGPGSFTGLRIGISSANALAYSQSIPIVARGENNWLEVSLKDLQSGQNDKLAQPEYGSPVHTTMPRK